MKHCPELIRGLPKGLRESRVGWCCPAVSGGRRTGRRDCEAAPRAWRPRAHQRNAPSADRIVCRGRAGERVAPPRASVSDGRQSTERDIKAAAAGGPATSQGGIWIRIASSGRADEPGQPRSPVPVWPGGPCVCWPTRRCCQLGTPPGRAIGPNFGGTLGRCRTVLRSATQAKSPLRPGLVCLGRLATYRLRRSCTALSGGRLTGPHDCEDAPHAWWRRG